MSLVLRIGGVDRSEFYEDRSLALTYSLETRDTIQFKLLPDYDGVPMPEVSNGTPVELEVDGVLWYSGSVERVTRRLGGSFQDSLIFRQVRCVDRSAPLYRRLVVSAWPAGNIAGDIARNLVEVNLASEGLTNTGIEDGVVLGAVRFDNVYAAQALDQLAQLSGYAWWVAPDGEVQFRPRESVVAPFTITTSSPEVLEIQCAEAREQYRNVQFVIGGEHEGAPRTDELVADGVQTSFATELPIAGLPTVEISRSGQAFASESVGVRDIDPEDETGPRWLYTRGERAIGQNRSFTALEEGDVFRTTYTPLLDTAELLTDGAEIESRQGIEGGSGRHERIDRDSRANSTEIALSLAAALLRRHGGINCEVQVETDAAGVRAGQLQRIDVPALGLADDFLITEVRIRDLGGDVYRTTYTAIDNEHVEGWAGFYKRLAEEARGQGFGVAEDATIHAVRQVGSKVGVTHEDQTATGDSLIDPLLDDYTVALVGVADVGTEWVDGGVRYRDGAYIGVPTNE